MKRSHYYRDIERILTGIRMVVVIANQRNGHNLFSKLSRIQYHASELFKLCYDFHSTVGNSNNSDGVNTTDSSSPSSVNSTSSQSSSSSSPPFHTADQTIRPTSTFSENTTNPIPYTANTNPNITNPLSTFMPETWKEVEKITAIINSKTTTQEPSASPLPTSDVPIDSTSTSAGSPTFDGKVTSEHAFKNQAMHVNVLKVDNNSNSNNNNNTTEISKYQSTRIQQPSPTAPVAVAYPYINTTPETNLQMKEKAVPSTHIERMVGFGSLTAGLLFGKAKETTQTVWYGSETMRDSMGVGVKNNYSSGGMSEENANRLAESLSRMRGAALKLGQMLSLNDEDYMPSTLSKALNRVRQGADYMPRYQLEKQMISQLGEEWKSIFQEFEIVPIAAASIGQVHRAILKPSTVTATDFNHNDNNINSNSNSGYHSISNSASRETADYKENNDDGTDTAASTQATPITAVAVKIQYPGVAQSIKSDLQNLKMLITVMNVLPKGIFIDQIIKVANEELTVECDYEAEAKSQIRYRELILRDPLLSPHVSVPQIYLEYCRKQLLVSDYIADTIPIDQAIHYPLSIRNHIARNMLILTLKELFEWKFIQSDPNFSNFLYAKNSGIIHCIDFGAAREYSDEFIDDYIELVWAAANEDSKTIIDVSKKMGFLSGDESAEMIEAHVQTGLLMGEPFRTQEAYDFGVSHITQRAVPHANVFAKQRLKAPPKETYSLHRKLAGAFLLCIRLKAMIPCRDILADIYHAYKLKQKEKLSSKGNLVV